MRRAYAPPASLPDAEYRRITTAWALYDWANSAFATTVIATVLPVYYGSLTRAAGIRPDESNAFWAYTNSAYMLVIALAGPFLGTFADVAGGKKRFIAGFMLLGVSATAALAGLPGDGWLWASALYMVASLGYAGGNIFYESLLPGLARPGDLDRVSTKGYALGYLGGGLLLVVNAVWLMKPEWFGFASKTMAVRACFISVAAWWGFFSLPLLFRTPEPPREATAPRAGFAGTLRLSFVQLAGTLRKIRRFRQLTLFLAAFWIYNDGISTIIKMASKYGESLGFTMSDLIAALTITQFVGFPCALGFGRLAGRLGAKRAIFGGLAVYVVISVFGYFMTSVTMFYVLAVLVGLVQGGTQALSRSLFASMVPKSQAAEFFGFYSTGAKFAGILGPLLFGVVATRYGSRPAIVAISVFFIVGAVLLLRVDEEEGRRVAAEVDARNEAGLGLPGPGPEAVVAPRPGRREP